MDVLFAPWRMEYILGPKVEGCVFCIPTLPEDDESQYILARGKLSFVLMNRYPYTNGHLMVAPYRHVSDLTDLNDQEALEIMLLARKSLQALRQTLQPEGVNVGVNLGEVAGAGIKEHLHVHIVPRWQGDASFITVCAHARVIPEHLAATYAKLAPFLTHLSPSTSF
jgi:ATP adenylyltransferase